MGKEQKKYISLSEVDHKMQFVNLIAVICDISPTIRQKRLRKIDLRLLDKTIEKPGFLVNLKMDSEILNQFLNVAKKGFVVEFRELKVTKDEGQINGHVEDEEELALYNESGNPLKWHPDETIASASATVKSKIIDLVQWKNSNSKDIIVLPDVTKENLKTRNSGSTPDKKGQSCLEESKKKNVTDGSSTQTQIANKEMKNTLETSDSGKKKRGRPRKSVLESPSSKNVTLNHLKLNNTRNSSKITDSPSASPQRASRSSTPSKISRFMTSSKMGKSSSVPNLSKLALFRTKISSSPSKQSKQKLNSGELKKSESLSKINQTSFQTRREQSESPSRRKKLSRGSKVSEVESDSEVSFEMKKLIPCSKEVSRNREESESDSENFDSPAGKKHNLKTRASNSAVHSKPGEETNLNKGKNEVIQTDSPNKNKKDVPALNSAETPIRNKASGDVKTKVDSGNIQKPGSNIKTKPSESKSRNNKKVKSDKEKSYTKISNCMVKDDSKLNSTSLTKEQHEKQKDKSEIDNNRKLSDTSDSLKRTRHNNTLIHNNETQEELMPRKKRRSLSVSTDCSLNDTITSTKLSTSETNLSGGLRQRSLRDDSKQNSSLSGNIIIRRSESFTKIPPLNLSDSTLSESTVDSASPGRRKDSSQVFISRKRNSSEDSLHKSISKKKLKSEDQMFLSNENSLYRSVHKKSLTVSKNGNEITKNSKENEIDKEKSFKKESNNVEKRVSGENDIAPKQIVVPDTPPQKDNDNNDKNSKPQSSSKTLKCQNVNLSSDTPTPKLTRSRNQVLDKSLINEDLKRNQARSSINETNNTAGNSKESVKYPLYNTYLQPLTKKLNFTSVINITDISLCDLEEVNVPEKLDLECKVISQFLLIEEGIQVIRVQDGTVCKKGTLSIPQASSWKGVLEEILKNPIVEEKSPFIDIIIFDYFRLDNKIVPGRFYRLNNIMAVTFQLREDPRKEGKHKGELFFCAEGQSVYGKILRPVLIKEIKEKLEEDTYKRLCSKVLDNKPELQTTFSDNSSAEKSKSEKEGSVESKKRKLTDSDLDSDVDRKEEKSLNEVKSKIKRVSDHSEFSNGYRNATDGSAGRPIAMNATEMSDETLLEETPPLLREISEIMHEESALGLPQTVSEDIHLKNSGSEVTFSQFCKGAELKGQQFRTSTQNYNESEGVVIDKPKLNEVFKNAGIVTVNSEELIAEDASKMEPLVYCPSGSSLNSAVEVSPSKALKPHENISNSEELSVSLLKDTRVKKISDIKLNDSDNNKMCNDNASDRSNSSSVKVISSNSSVEVDMRSFECMKSPNSNYVNKNKGKTTEVIKLCDVSSEIIYSISENAQKTIPLSPRKSIAEKSGDKVKSESGLQNGFISGKVISKESRSEQIEIVSDNSSNNSLLTVDKNNAVVKPMTCFNNLLNENEDFNAYNLEEMSKVIPDRCFYKSAPKPAPLTEDELCAIYDDENSPVKYFSYCHNRDLPMLTLDVVDKIRNTNSLTLTVTFTSIIPSFTDSWKDSCIKSQCPSCKKLYDVYNAANNKNSDITSTAAISVGSHIVCPDSQCCNQTLDSPEFHFSVELKLEDSTPLTALLASTYAEDVFGCSAQEAIKNENDLNRVGELLEKINKNIVDNRPTTIVVTREDICHPKSGPVYVQKILF